MALSHLHGTERQLVVPSGHRSSRIDIRSRIRGRRQVQRGLVVQEVDDTSSLVVSELSPDV